MEKCKLFLSLEKNYKNFTYSCKINLSFFTLTHKQERASDREREREREKERERGREKEIEKVMWAVTL